MLVLINFLCFVEITCRKIPRNNDKLTAKNLDCFKSSLKIDEQCEFECSDEFLRIGPKSMTCKKGKGAIGVWEYSGSSSQHPSCVGKEVFSTQNGIYHVIHSLHKIYTYVFFMTLTSTLFSPKI